MLGRTLLTLAAVALIGFVLLVLIGLWDRYEQEAKALGFSGIYEQSLASKPGFMLRPFGAFRFGISTRGRDVRFPRDASREPSSRLR